MSIQIPNDNPAGRLYAFFLHLHHAAKNHPNEPSMKVLCIALDINATDHYRIHSSLTDVWKQLTDAKDAIRSMSNINTELFLASFPALETILEQLPRTNGSALVQQLKQPAFLQGLGFCASQLSAVGGELVLDDKEIGQLREQVEAIIGSLVDDSKIPEILRDHLVYHFELIRHALLAYSLSGIDGVIEAIESTLGGIVFHRDTYSEARKCSTTIQRGEEFLDQLGQTANNCKRGASAIKKISEAVREVISSIGP